MKRSRLRLRAIVVAGTAGTLVVALVIAGWGAIGATRTDAAMPEIASAARRLAGEAVAVGAVLALVFGLLLAWGLGSFLTLELNELRGRILQRARGGRVERGSGRLRELQAVDAAVDLLAHELTTRAHALDAERVRLVALLAAVNEGIVRIDADGRMGHANPAALTLLGLPVQDAIPIASVVRDPELRDLVTRALAGESVLTREITIGARTLLVSGRPLPGGGAVLSVADLSELRRLEGVRRDFVANASHELKTPLTSIRGYAETLLGADVDPDTRRQFLQVIEANATRLQHIVDDLLDLSRIESGRWTPERSPVDAAGIARDAWNDFRLAAARRSIRFDVTGRADVRADAGALHQIFVNLFDNALRYTSDGGHVHVRINTDGDRVEIAVQDDGSGIPGDALPRIFERFYRVDPARSRSEGGTGLGLAIVRHLVEAMDGSVRAESQLGKGTTIIIHLIRSFEADAAPRAS